MMDRFEISGSTLGEVWAGAVLSCLGIPIGLAGGLPLRLTLAVAMAWALAFAAGIFAVKGLITLRKTGSRGTSSWGLALVVVGLVLESLWWKGPVVAVMPLTLACIGTLVWAPSPKALRKIGWTLVGVTVLAATLMVLAVRNVQRPRFDTRSNAAPIRRSGINDDWRDQKTRRPLPRRCCGINNIVINTIT